MNKVCLWVVSALIFSTTGAAVAGERCSRSLSRYDGESLRARSSASKAAQERQREVDARTKARELRAKAHREAAERHEVFTSAVEKVLDQLQKELDEAVEGGKSSVIFDIGHAMGNPVIDLSAEFPPSRQEEVSIALVDKVGSFTTEVVYLASTHNPVIDALVEFCRTNALELKFQTYDRYEDYGNPMGDTEYPAYEDIRYTGRQTRALVSWD